MPTSREIRQQRQAQDWREERDSDPEPEEQQRSALQ